MIVMMMKHLQNVSLMFDKFISSDINKLCNYNSLQNFKKDLINFCRLSLVLDKNNELEYFSNANFKEHMMFQKIKVICDENKYNFDHFENNITSVDCIINNKNIQCKASDHFHGNKHGFAMYRTKNGIRVPYSDKDNIDLFIFWAMEEDIFYIVPIKILIEKGYIKTDYQEGKFALDIPQKTCKVKCVTPYFFEFYNRFELLDPNYKYFKINFEIGLDRQCIKNKLPFTIEYNDNNRLRVKTINNFKIIFYTSQSIEGHMYKFAINHRNRNPFYNLQNINFDFVIFEIVRNHDLYYIIPRCELIKQQKIDDLSIHLPPPEYNGIHWANIYLNNFMQFSVPKQIPKPKLNITKTIPNPKLNITHIILNPKLNIIKN
jgi:hypothetical protein